MFHCLTCVLLTLHIVPGRNSYRYQGSVSLLNICSAYFAHRATTRATWGSDATGSAVGQARWSTLITRDRAGTVGVGGHQNSLSISEIPTNYIVRTQVERRRCPIARSSVARARRRRRPSCGCVATCGVFGLQNTQRAAAGEVCTVRVCVCSSTTGTAAALVPGPIV